MTHHHYPILRVINGRPYVWLPTRPTESCRYSSNGYWPELKGKIRAHHIFSAQPLLFFCAVHIRSPLAGMYLIIFNIVTVKAGVRVAPGHSHKSFSCVEKFALYSCELSRCVLCVKKPSNICRTFKNNKKSQPPS